jgi:UTP--glucose-1-phosphate uridylyltransferase
MACSKAHKTIKKCLFPVAGYGTRFLPATKNMPKEMLPILDKPLIQYGVEEAYASGMDQICFVTGRGKRALEDYFDFTYEIENYLSGSPKERRLAGIHELITQCIFTYTRQHEMRGLGHAILVGESLIGDEPFGAILSDDLCIGKQQAVMGQLQDVYEKHGCSVVAVEEVDPADVDKYGVVAATELEDGVFSVSDMVEKPAPGDAPSNLAIIGRYLLTPDIFDILRNTPPGKNGEIQITDALRVQAREGRVIAYRFKGKRFDCGSIDGFVAATNFFYRKRGGPGSEEQQLSTINKSILFN